MSEDVTGKLPHIDETSRAPDTNPLLDRILEGVTALANSVAELRAELADFKTEVRVEFAKTRSIFREELTIETRNIHERMGDFERRLKAIEQDRRVS